MYFDKIEVAMKTVQLPMCKTYKRIEHFVTEGLTRMLKVKGVKP